MPQRTPQREANVPPIPPIERSRLVDDVTARLREMIVSGDLPPGTPLRQIELSERLGVSRTPLREAFRILESDGLVRIANGNRTVEVTRYTTEDLRHLYEIREVVDGLAARLAARKGLTPEEDERLQDVLREIDAVTGSRTVERARRVRAHVAFHVAIAEASGNRRVVDMVPLISMTASSLYPSFQDDNVRGEFLEYLDEGVSQHHAIYEAIAERDSRRAETLARRHIRVTLRSGLLEAATPPA